MLDPTQFLNTQTTSALSTQLDPIPKGEYKAVSQPLDKDSFQSFDIKKGERAGTKGWRLNLVWKIDDEAAGEYNGRLVRQQFFLDLNPAGDGLDFGKGKNIGLGRLREALGQNQDGQPWAPSMLGSQVARIAVDQRLDENDPSKIYNDVVGVTRL